MGELYSTEQIQRAFWSAFYGAGELFFPEPLITENYSDETDCNNAVKESWQELLKALKEEKMHRLGKLIFFLMRLFRLTHRRMVGWAPVGKVYVCPACDHVRKTIGFCIADGARLVLRDEPMCPNGHPQAVLGRYPKTHRYCHVCGAENPGEES